MKKVLFIVILLLGSISSFAQKSDSRFFELRTYYTFPGRQEALIKRFTNHTTRLFEKHGMTNIGYWKAETAPDRIIYVLAYPDKAARDSSWKAFNSDPEWRKVAKESEADGKIVEKVESVFMDALPFSKIK